MKRIVIAVAVLGVAVLAACGGGGGSGALPPSTPGVGQPAPASTAASFTASNAVAIPTAAPGAASVPVPVASAPGAAAALALPAGASVPADTTIDASYASTMDASLPALSAARKTLGRSVREDGSRSLLAMMRMRFSSDVTLAQAPGFTFTVPGSFATSGATYWLAFYDPLRAAAGWQLGWEGPATLSATTQNGVSATTFSFASNGLPLTFVAGQNYGVALYALAAGAPSPTPVPSGVPTNAPHEGKPSPVVASPSPVFFPSVSSSPVAVTFSQPNFTGPFVLRGDCTGIVNTSGTSPTFTLTPVAQGRCVVIGLGDRGASAVVHVGVVTAPETPHPQQSESPEPQESPTATPSPVATPTATPT